MTYLITCILFQKHSVFHESSCPERFPDRSGHHLEAYLRCNVAQCVGDSVDAGWSSVSVPHGL